MESLIKLKLTEQAKESNKSQLVMETFIDSCIKLDASIFEPLIDEDQLFQDLDKYSFLQSLKNLFDSLKTKNIANTELKLAKCQGCQRGHITHEFYANGHFQFAYILFKEKDVLIDIFRCNFSTNELLKPFPF
jgi:hypothetical protein